MTERINLAYNERKERPDRARLVITGIGAITPIGNNAQETWNNLLRGENKATTIVNEQFKARVAIPIADYDPLKYFTKHELKRLGRAAQFSLIASTEAMKDAGILSENGKLIEEIAPLRAGVHIGTGIGGIEDYAIATKLIEVAGPSKVDPFALLRILPERVTSVPSIERGLSGWSGTTVAACATGATNIAEAGILIQADKADIMLCGGTEGTLTPAVMAGFGNMHALSSDFNDDPKRASRPYNIDSKGFVPSEGAVIFVLEELNHAIDRGANIYAELAGMHCSADAKDSVAPDAQIIARTIQIALQDARQSPGAVDLIVAHATSTGLSEETETQAAKLVFGDKLPALTAPKSIVGHSLGAAGALNAFVAIKAIQESRIPPTINIDNRNPYFKDIDIVTSMRDQKVNIAIADAFGFGGMNAVLVFIRYEI